MSVVLGRWFWKYVSKTATCWLWCGPRARTEVGRDYGRVQRDGVRTMAHKLSYEAHVGAVPAGKLVLHRCDVPSCVNPDHLFLGSHGVNSGDMLSKRRNAHGESHPRAKLTWSAVRRIRKMHASGKFTLVMLARRFGVSDSTIRHIVNGTKWRE